MKAWEAFALPLGHTRKSVKDSIVHRCVLSREILPKFILTFNAGFSPQNGAAWHPALCSPVRLRQSPKRHLADPSLVAALLGANPVSLANDPKTLGLLFESLVLHDLKVYASLSDARLFHYHDANGLEVDGIVQARDDSWMAVEVKLSTTQVPDAAKNLLRLERVIASHGDRAPAAKCIVIRYGAPAHVTAEGVAVIPVDILRA